MSPTLKSLGLDRLSVADRLRLVEEIWDGLAESAESLDVPDSHRALLDSRIASHEADPGAGSSWAEVQARLRTLSGGGS